MTEKTAYTLGLLLVASCSTPMQTISSATEAAERVTRLTWFMVVLSVVVYAIVIAAMVMAIRRNRQRSTTEVDLSRPGVRPIIIGGVVLPALVLTAVFTVAETALGRTSDKRPAFTINVTGRQWWWDLEYALPTLSDRFRTANEIHIPVNTPVHVRVTSNDVIHSFWVPRLQGKIDVIPGDTNELRLLARIPGTYRGQCAEFCGAQHARMGITVVVDDSATFARWLGDQIAEARPPTDSLHALGQQLFVTGACAMCHAVRGTEARAQVAPDLTHVGSRLTIAAGTLPNNQGSLEAWITNAQAVKPGTKMPTLSDLPEQQLRAIAAYVASLR
ncbi:MAG TPA: cytochrome c oxidase subunit II [Gemmatimonadaceae bacterium]